MIKPLCPGWNSPGCVVWWRQYARQLLIVYSSGLVGSSSNSFLVTSTSKGPIAGWVFRWDCVMSGYHRRQCKKKWEKDCSRDIQHLRCVWRDQSIRWTRWHALKFFAWSGKAKPARVSVRERERALFSHSSLWAQINLEHSVFAILKKDVGIGRVENRNLSYGGITILRILHLSNQ